MRPFTLALLAAVVAVPVGIASRPAHADNDNYYNQRQRFDKGWHDHDQASQYRPDERDGQRYGMNDQQDRDRHDVRPGDQRDHDANDHRPGQQFGYNGAAHRWGDNDRHGNNDQAGRKLDNNDNNRHGDRD